MPPNPFLSIVFLFIGKSCDLENGVTSPNDDSVQLLVWYKSRIQFRGQGVDKPFFRYLKVLLVYYPMQQTLFQRPWKFIMVNWQIIIVSQKQISFDSVITVSKPRSNQGIFLIVCDITALLYPVNLTRTKTITAEVDD